MDVLLMGEKGPRQPLMSYPLLPSCRSPTTTARAKYLRPTTMTSKMVHIWAVHGPHLPLIGLVSFPPLLQFLVVSSFKPSCTATNRFRAGQVTFSAIPTDFIDWMYAFPGASSKFPWLSECTDWTRSPPTGAPTVHVVVSTLTHKTSSVIATSPGNFGGVVSSKTERTTSKAVETSRTAGISETKKPSTSEIVGTTVIAIPTTSPVAEQTTDKVTDSGLPSTIEGEPPTTADAPRTTPVLPVEGTTSEVRTTANGAAPVSTNNQVHTGGEFTETQQTGASEAQQVNPTVPNEGSKPVSVPQETSAGQQTATATITAGQSSVGAGDSSESGNPAIVAPVLTFGSTTVAPNSASEYIVSSQTLAPGGPAITFGETTYSLATSATVIVANGQTQPLTVQHTEPAAPQITLGSSIVAQNSDSAYVYGSQTISAGGPAITVGSTTYSLLTSNSATFVIENGVTHPVATLPAAGPTLTLGNSIITANSASEYIINSQTLTAGGPEITVGETTYSLGTADSTTYLVQNGQTPAPAPAGEVTNDAPIVSVVNAAAPAITIGSSIIIQNPASEYILNSQTLAPGGSAIVDKGTTYSLAAPGTAVFVNGATVPISAAETAVLVAGKTLFPNSAIEVSGTTYALPPSGTGLLINGVSSALPTNAPVIATFGSAVATAVSGGYILGSETLVSGAEVTVSGTTYSLVASAVVVNGVTSPLPTQATLPYAYIVGSATLSPGSGVVVSGTTYSISIPTNPSTPPTLLINNTPAPLPSVGLVTVDGDVYTAIPAAGSGVVVGTQTLFPSGTITVAAASGGAETLRLGSQGVEVVGETGVKATSSPGQTGMGTARGTARGSETQTQTGTQTQTQGAAAASTSTSAAVAVKQNDGVVAAGFAAAVMGALLAFI